MKSRFTATEMSEVRANATSPRFAHGIFIILITILVYLQTVRFPFLNLDDTTFIVGHQYALQWSSVPAYFTGLTSDELKISYFYRPLVSCWTLLNYKFFGLHAGLWHLAAVILYSLGVWLVWRLAWRLTKNDFIALLAGLLYALHPLHVEGVAWISGAGVETLLTVFFVGGFLAYLRWRETRRPFWLVICGILVFCALLSKETGAALPVLITAHALIFRSGVNGSTERKPWHATAIVMALVTILYTAIRLAVTHAIVLSSPRHHWGDFFRTAPLLYVTYLQHALWPAHLGGWYDISVVSSLDMAHFYLPLALCLAGMGIMVWAILRKLLAGFLLLWWVVILGPAIVGILSFPDFDLVHDRFLFLPLVGLCILVADLVDRLPAGGPSLFGFKRSSAAVAVVVTILLAVLTTRQVTTWSSGLALYVHAIEVSPRAPKPRIFLASELVREHDLAQAIAVDRGAMSIDPNRWQTVFHYGMTLATAGYREEGQRQLYRAVELAPTQPAVYYGLGAVLAEAGDFQQSIKILEQGIAAADDPAPLREKLAQVKARAQAAQQRPANR